MFRYYIFLFTIISYFGCTTEKIKELSKGFIQDNIYYNPQLNWSMPVDSSWSIPSELEKEYKLLERVSLVSDPTKVIKLLNWKENKLQSLEFTFDFNEYEEISSIKDYIGTTVQTLPSLIEGIKRQIPNGENLKSDYQKNKINERIDGLKFEGVEFYFKIDTTQVYFMIIAAKIKGGYLSIGLTTAEPNLKNKFWTKFKASSFSATSFPEVPPLTPDSILIDSIPLFFKKDAEILFQSYIEKDYAKAIKFMHPKLFMEIEKTAPKFDRKEFIAEIFKNLDFSNQLKDKDLTIVFQKPQQIGRYQNFYFSLIKGTLTLTSNKGSQILKELPISFIGVYSQIDKQTFFIENNLAAFEIIAKDIPRHALRKVITERDYLDSFNKRSEDWAKLIE